MKTKKIVIDARFWGLENTGLGRYTMRLIEELTKLDKQNQYYLLVRKKIYQELNGKLKTKNWKLIIAEARHYTFKEQFLLTKILWQLKPDIYHVPHFNIPVLWKLVSPKTKLVVTIHDLIKHQSVGKETTTLPITIYWLKLAIYKLVLQLAISKSSAIIVPSNYIKQQLAARFRLSITKIHVTYEAPDEIYYKKTKKQLLINYQLIADHYLIYTGNAYPHKNLKALIQAMMILKQVQDDDFKLAIVCARDVFRQRIENLVKHSGLEKQIKFHGFVSDEELRELYRHSLAFITPSLLEGFGLSGLEAMAAGTPILSSNSSCLPEIYQKYAVYFDPHNPQDITDKILQLIKLTPTQKNKLIDEGIKYTKTFSWGKMANQTLKVYKSL